MECARTEHAGAGVCEGRVGRAERWHYMPSEHRIASHRRRRTGMLGCSGSGDGDDEVALVLRTEHEGEACEWQHMAAVGDEDDAIRFSDWRHLPTFGEI